MIKTNRSIRFIILILFVQLTISCGYFSPPESAEEEPDVATVVIPTDSNEVDVDSETDTPQTVVTVVSTDEASEPNQPDEPTPLPSPTIIASILTGDLGDPNPRLIDRSPSAGDELAPNEPIELYFDQPMNPETTAAAFSLTSLDGQGIAGTVAWPQPRILRFTPGTRLAPSTLFNINLAESATAATGLPLTEPIIIDLTTQGALEVTQLSPAPGSDSVSSDAAITVIFNRPVVPLVNRDAQDELPSPISIRPAAKGIGSWINTSVYVWRPSAPLLGRQTYEVTVNAATVNQVSTSGSRLPEDVVWRFTVMPPTLNRITLPGLTDYVQDDGQDHPLEQPIDIWFNQPMDRTATEQAISFYSNNGSAGLEYGWNDLDTRVTITPTRRLAYRTDYTLDVADSARSASGGRLQEQFLWRTTTIPEPGIASTEPTNGAAPFEFSSHIDITFLSPMDPDTLADKVIIEPAPIWRNPDISNRFYSPWSNFYRIWGLQPSTDYTVTLLPGMADEYGTRIEEEQVIRFRTAARTPQARLLMNGPFSLYRQNGTTAAWAQYTNTADLTFDLYRFYQPAGFFRRLKQGDTLNFSPGELEYIQTETVQTSAELNNAGYQRFELRDPNGNMHPPGYYFLTLNSAGVDSTPNLHNSARPFLIANANLTLKTTGSEALMWLTSLDTGAPLSEVELLLLDQNFEEIRRGVTDESGLLYFNDLVLDTSSNADYYAITNSATVLGASISSWDDGVNPWEFNVSTNYRTVQNQLRGYLYTDRPLYRPGQEVFVKGIIRSDDDLDYRLPLLETVEVQVSSFEGTVFEETVSVNQMGSFETSLTLAEEATIGFYSIEVREPLGGDWIGSGEFDVAEFRKPTFQVEVSPDRANILAGENARFTISADFFSGGAVANGELTWQLYGQSTIFAPSDVNLGRYSFNTDERDQGYNPFLGSPDFFFGPILMTGQGTTDADGQLVVEIPAERLQHAELDGSGTIRLMLEATVTDIAGNEVSGRSELQTHPGALYAGIRTDSYIGQVGAETGFELVVVDLDGAVQANQTVAIEVVQRQWSNVEQIDEASGATVWESVVEEISVTTLTTAPSDGNGRTTGSFVPEEGGVYRAYATIRDAGGNEIRTSTFFWVSGGSFVTWRRINDHSFEIIPDAESYRPGETAELLIASPFEGRSYALVTVERGHIYSQEVIELNSNSTIYQLPITGAMAPNMYVSVMVTKGVDEFSSAPDFKVSYTQFTVSPEEQALDIEIIPDRETVGPQETVNYTVRVTDYTGAPVEAELSLALVDKALLALKPDPQLPLLDFFYTSQPLAVATSLLLTREMDSYNQALEAEINSGGLRGGGGEGGGGGGGGGMGGGGFNVIAVREEFKDTAFWRGQLMTDSSGVAQVSIDLPDNLTTWQLDVRAATADTKVGQAINDVVTTKPLLVSPLTPRFFILGDQASVGTIVRNTTDQPIEAEVNLAAEGVTLITTATQPVVIEPNGSAAVYWDVEVTDNFEQGAEMRADFLFAVRDTGGSGYEDASRPTLGRLEGQGIPIYRYELSETVATSGQLLEGGTLIESIGLPIYPESDYRPTVGELTIAVSPSLAAAMSDGLDYLDQFPYECTEQLVSKFLPNVLTTQALRVAGVSNPELEANLDTEIGTALQSLYARQLPGGGWSWWDDTNGRPNTLVTAYVVLGLLEARDAGYAVRDRAIDSGLNYLRENVSTVDGLSGRAKVNRQAFVTFVLARGGLSSANTLNQLYQERQTLDIYARAFLTRAVYAQDPGDPRIPNLLSDLNSAAVVSAAGTHWEEEGRHDVWNWNTDTRTSAIVLGTLAEIDPENLLIANGVRWLMAHRTDTHWHGTQETAWALMALNRWMVASGELEANFEYEVAVNGSVVGAGTASRETLRDTQEVRLEVTELLTTDLNRLALGRTAGPGTLYYSANLAVELPVEEIGPRDDGIIISRSYYDPNDPERPITDTVVGDTVMVRLSIIAPNALHYVSIEDWLPAGLEAIDSSLQTSQQLDPTLAGTGGQRVNTGFNISPSRGWGWWYFDHVQLRDERVEISADYLPRGSYEYVYLARASTPGSFSVIPPRAEQFYFPDVSGRGSGMRFTVHPLGTPLARESETGANADTLRIVFAPNATTGEAQGEVGPGETQTYVLQAAGGGSMAVDIISPNSDVAFTVIGPDGVEIGTTQANSPTWRGVLPADGDYSIAVRSVGGRTGFLMTVSVE